MLTIGRTNSVEMHTEISAFHAEFQHLRALALLSPGTTPQICPVDTLVNTSNKVPRGDGLSIQTIAPCSLRYVLSMDDLARLRLKARSDVVSTWEIASTTNKQLLLPSQD